MALNRSPLFGAKNAKIRKNNIRIIDDAGDLLQWLIERMESSEKRVRISPELNALCDRFIELLSASEPIALVPVTRNAILRDAQLEPHTGQIYVERSAEIVNLLGGIGKRLEKLGHPFSVPIEDLVICVARIYPSSVANTAVLSMSKGFRVISSESAIRGFGVYFDMTCRSLYDPRWLSRFVASTY